MGLFSKFFNSNRKGKSDFSEGVAGRAAFFNEFENLEEYDDIIELEELDELEDMEDFDF